LVAGTDFGDPDGLSLDSVNFLLAVTKILLST
jgi:hypothetical protein